MIAVRVDTLPRVGATALVRGPRVHLRLLGAGDRDAFLEAVQRSRPLHRPWSRPPHTASTFADYLRTHRPPAHATLVVVRNADDALLGVYAISQIFQGNFKSAYLGYNAFEPFAAQGYMSEGMRLVFRYAFDTLGLHRLQANVQPGNVRSIALLRATGWREEGYARRYLKIGGRWRDHVMFAILAEDRGHSSGARRRA
jgi:ribosomal-protein-alanine N-acetyltransferase